MGVHVLESSEHLGQVAALHASRFLQVRIEANGEARIVLSTGASQFELFKSFVPHRPFKEHTKDHRRRSRFL